MVPVQVPLDGFLPFLLILRRPLIHSTLMVSLQMILQHLTFAMTGDAGGPQNNSYLLDSVSVIDTNTSTNVLINGGFETGDFMGWTQYCNTTANCDDMNPGVHYGHLITSSCYSGGYCYMDGCMHYDYLVQSFPTVTGDYYLISFYFRAFNIGPQVIYVMLT